MRGAKVRLVDKGRRPTVLYRPIQRIFLLKVNCGEQGIENLQLDPPIGDPFQDTLEDVAFQERNTCTEMQCPKRAAAREAQDKIMACALSEN